LAVGAVQTTRRGRLQLGVVHAASRVLPTAGFPTVPEALLAVVANTVSLFSGRGETAVQYICELSDMYTRSLGGQKITVTGCCRNFITIGCSVLPWNQLLRLTGRR